MGASCSQAAISHGGVETMAALLAHPSELVTVAAAAAIDAAMTAIMVSTNRGGALTMAGSQWPAWIGAFDA